METTAKITSVQENQKQWEWQGTKYFDHWIKFEGSDKVWVYSSKSQTCDKFKTGVVATFETSEKPGNNGYVNCKIKPAQSAGGGFKGAPKDQGVITALSCLSSACNLHQQSSTSLEPEAVLKTAEQFYQWASKKSTLNK